MSLKINLKTEIKKITDFIKSTLKREGFSKVVIGLSGGIDSTTSFYLLKKVLSPKNIIVANLYYQENKDNDLEKILKDAKIPKENIYRIGIKKIVDCFTESLHFEIPKQVRNDNKIRLGNIMARVRMIILFDLAKKHKALVCGTENKSEHYLGYFTRFGDAASDFEPIRHLYKTQLLELAKYLEVPKNIIEKKPTANLWQGQTDEDEFGFTYKEADEVLYLYLEKKLKVNEIKKRAFKKTDKIIHWVIKNKFKHETPHAL
ncbi:MAG: NAD+ synthase [Candidatus Levyibacteriota bacterium]